MKPNFALILSADTLTLLHRCDRGWAPVGDVSLGGADMAPAMSALKDRAHRLSDDATCKLVIPNDQIKYLSINAVGDPDAAVRAALDGATPYAVDELEYDWTAADGVIQVAAVARDTLAEAEGFATEHGFDAVSFAAIPDEGAFRGEPFFGMTRRAAETLPQGTIVARDDTAIRVVSDAEIPAQSPLAEDDVSEADMPGDTSVASAAARAVAEAPPTPELDRAEATGPEVDSAPDQVPAGQSDQDTNRQTAGAKAAPPPAMHLSPPQAPGTFTSIRATRGEGATGGASALYGNARLSRLGGVDTAPGAEQGAAPSLPSPADDVADPARLAELAASLQPDPETRLDQDAVSDSRRAETAASATGLLAQRKDKPAKASAPLRRSTSPREDERQRMTVFGARQDQVVRGKPRFLGLILTAVLLLFLVGVAAWASIFLDEGLARLFGTGDDIRLANVPATDETDTGDAEDPVMPDDGADAQATIAPLPDTNSPDERVAALPEGAAVESLPDLPAPLAPSEATARYAATGIWQMAPVSPEIPRAGAPLNDLYEVSFDVDLGLGDPADLPRRRPDARDTRPETPINPPPAGMRFDFDDRGFVRATPDGAMTPQGVRVIAGRPPLTPPADMAQTVTVTATPDTAESDLPAGASFAGDPSLAGMRPRLRPESLIANDNTPDSTAPETREDGQNITDDATNDPSLIALRPRTRPAETGADAATLQSAQGAAGAPLVDGAALTRAVASAGAVSTDAVTGTEEGEDQAEAGSFDNATAQAVTASLMPLHRPGDFATVVKRTRARAAAQPVSASQRLQPAVPTSASVARQATDKDVIKLHRVNLIGVYGSASDRRALVRLDNGRYKKVQVGDRLDGGQVAAIGDSQLRYIKRGKNVLLRIPQG